MTRRLIVTILTVLTFSAAGCQSSRWRPWGNTPAVTTPLATYGYADPGLPPPANVSPPASAGSCGPGCSSCSTPSLPILSSPQAYALDPST